MMNTETKKISKFDAIVIRIVGWIKTIFLIVLLYFTTHVSMCDKAAYDDYGSFCQMITVDGWEAGR